ncbi:MAG: type II toxin-antitoxin system RelB/DinJ family antitoxin [Oscillospiraceae bacterium]|nr:type II toxin-antitoxin system RelB/DinJ family antitoxin [Oscillospiraceae bacterium]
MTRISIRMDEELRKEADIVLHELGLTMSSAVNIFVKQLVRQGGMPFTPMLETRQALEKKRRERLDSLLNFASQNKRIESGYKFVRDECYDR